ncbi:hypothetical protein [Streptomyces hokutonensis]|uniref:hypothetical protein n=1 Tax=Streptomyces hokutonensis TaxID=1306990 RepID=UPI001FE209A8|nr:hypothetical protein [Streptomyces hokutonensis]
MEISFSSSPDYVDQGRERAQGGDLAAVSRADLEWYYFLGRLSISRSGVEIGPPWGWAPLFYAIHCVRQVMVFAQGGNALGKIDFTENDEFISFHLEQGGLRMVPTYLESELYCSVDEFVTAGVKFIREELERVVTEYPSLANNRHVCALSLEAGLEFPEA